MPKKKKEKNIKLMDRFKIDDIIITNHAYDKFKELCEKLEIEYEEPYTDIKNLLTQAKLDTNIRKKGYMVKRILSNNFQSALYFISDGWRFVIVDKEYETILVTIEREKKEENF